MDFFSRYRSLTLEAFARETAGVNKKIPKNIVYVLLLLIPVFLLFARPVFLNVQKNAVVESSTGPLAFIAWPFQEFKKILFYHVTYEEYAKLRKENGGLWAKITNAKELLEENRRLTELLDFKRSIPYDTVAAVVVGRDPTNWNAMLIIDKGRKSGIKIGMPVVNPAGVVGKVSEVADNISKVILVSDPNFNVAAVTQDSRESGLLTGTLQGLCRLRYLPEDAGVKVGEKIVTSKLSSTFPDGILIGTVVNVSNRADTTGTECLVHPATFPSRAEEILVLKKEQ